LTWPPITDTTNVALIWYLKVVGVYLLMPGTWARRRRERKVGIGSLRPVASKRLSPLHSPYPKASQLAEKK
jgi:hypothetical protein